MELRRTKNLATIIVFPIMKNDGTLITGAANLDSEIDAWSDGAAPDGFTDCANEATEIGTTGQYYLSLTQAEMNADYIIIQVKSSTTGAVTQTLLINTSLQRAEVITNNDKTGYALTTTPPTTAEVKTALEAGGSYLALIKAKTDNLPASPAATGDILSAAAIRTEMDANSTKLANLDAAISTRAAAATALSTATWTAEKAGYLDAAISGLTPATPVNITVEHTDIMTSK